MRGLATSGVAALCGAAGALLATAFELSTRLGAAAVPTLALAGALAGSVLSLPATLGRGGFRARLETAALLAGFGGVIPGVLLAPLL